jgi:hypothetical protein
VTIEYHATLRLGDAEAEEAADTSAMFDPAVRMVAASARAARALVLAVNI